MRHPRRLLMVALASLLVPGLPAVATELAISAGLAVPLLAAAIYGSHRTGHATVPGLLPEGAETRDNPSPVVCQTDSLPAGHPQHVLRMGTRGPQCGRFRLYV